MAGVGIHQAGPRSFFDLPFSILDLPLIIFISFDSLHFR
jgi:hypothetical protein